MRTIKFRAWHKKTKKMYEVRELCYTPSGQLWVSAINEYKDGKFYKATRDLEWGIDVSAELMQSTDLKDSKEVEIYEGDILKSLEDNGEVIWITGESRIGEHDDQWGDTPGFALRKIFLTEERPEYDEFLDFSSDRIYEVIGNIYENPELIKSKP